MWRRRTIVLIKVVGEVDCTRSQKSFSGDVCLPLPLFPPSPLPFPDFPMVAFRVLSALPNEYLRGPRVKLSGG